MATTHILLTGKIEQGGEIEWNIAPLPVDEPLTDGELQRMIDDAHEWDEYRLDMEWLDHQL